MDESLQLDPQNPPRYCPQCARSGVKSKVKKFKMDSTSTELVIMCKNDKCPWPFSVQSKAEATVVVGESSLIDSSLDVDNSKINLSLSQSVLDCKNITDKMDETHVEVSKDVDMDGDESQSRNKQVQLFNSDIVNMKTLLSENENIVQTSDQEFKNNPSVQDYSLSQCVGTSKTFLEIVEQVTPLPGKTPRADINAQSNNCQIELLCDPWTVSLTEESQQLSFECSTQNIQPITDGNTNSNGEMITKISDAECDAYNPAKSVFDSEIPMLLPSSPNPNLRCSSPPSSTSTPKQDFVTQSTPRGKSSPVISPHNNERPFLSSGMVVEVTHAEYAVTAIQIINDNLHPPTSDNKYRVSRKSEACIPAYEKRSRKPKLAPSPRPKRSRTAKSIDVLSKPPLPLSIPVDDDENAKDVAEQARIEAMIAPPYPRRRGSSSTDKSKGRFRSPRDSKTKIKAELPDLLGCTSSTELLPKSKNPTHVETSKTTEDIGTDNGNRVSEIHKTKRNRSIKRKYSVTVDVDESHADETHASAKQDDVFTVLVPKIVYTRTKKLKQSFQSNLHPAIIDDNMITLDEATSPEMTTIIGPESLSGCHDLVGVCNVNKELGVYNSEDIETVSQVGNGLVSGDVVLNSNDKKCDVSWFWWREWVINQEFLSGFSNYMRTLVAKWAQNENGLMDMDPRVFALMKEKELHKQILGRFENVVAFFSEVFVKFVYLKSKLALSDFARLFKILKQTHRLGNQEFKSHHLLTGLIETTCKEQEQETPRCSFPINSSQLQASNSDINQSSTDKPLPAHGLVNGTPHCTVNPINLSTKEAYHGMAASPSLPFTELDYQSGDTITHGQVKNDVNMVLVEKTSDVSPHGSKTEGLDSISKKEWDETLNIENKTVSKNVIDNISDVKAADERSKDMCSLEAMKVSCGNGKTEGELKDTIVSIKSKTISTKGQSGILEKLLDISKIKSMNVDLPSKEVKGATRSTASRRKSQKPSQFITPSASNALDINKQSLSKSLDGKVKDVKQSASESNDSVEHSAADASEGLHGFTQADAMKKQVDKIKRIMESQTRRPDEGSERRFAGFGETLAPEEKISTKRRRKENESNFERVKNKTEVTKAERDLIEELLSIGDASVADSNPIVADVPPLNSNVSSSITDRVNNSILELEQLETLQEPGDIVDDFSSMFEL